MVIILFAMEVINWYRLFAVYKTGHFLDFLIYYWG